MRIDFDAPIYHAATGRQVFVHSIEGPTDDIIVVQDSRGAMMRFDWTGNPIGHLHRLTNNGGMYQHPVRTRLAQIIHLRALQMLGLDVLQMEQHEAWGSF